MAKPGVKKIQTAVITGKGYNYQFTDLVHAYEWLTQEWVKDYPDYRISRGERWWKVCTCGEGGHWHFQVTGEKMTVPEFLKRLKVSKEGVEWIGV